MSLVGLLLPVFCLLLVDYVNNNNVNAEPVECLASDQEALTDFKNGLEDPKNLLSSWRDSNCCQWRGILCDNITGAVVAIDLRNPYPLYYQYPLGRYGLWNLSGEIRPSLMKLKSLSHLDLSYNTFKGIPFPTFFGSLVNLQYLNLSNAGFAGTIPPTIGNLSRLQFLDLSSFSLHAENLQWVTGLVSLKHLSMNQVDLSLVGTEWVTALSHLPSLIELHLRACKLTGYFPSLPSLNFTSLVVLDLPYNHIVSSIPDWLVNISSLQHIDMTHNFLYGRIPFGLADMPKLQSLLLGSNTNLIASSSQLLVGRWAKIQELDFAYNRLQGELPSSFGNLTSLTYIDLSFNAVEGSIPGSLGKLCNLSYLSFSGNMIRTLPEFLRGTGNCPSRKPLPNLKVFMMGGNQLVGKIPDWLVKLENLVQLSLDGNMLEGHIPAFSGSLQKLTDLELDDNKLNGTLPESLGQLSELSYLDVSSNELTGMITEAHFSKLSKLSTLDLSSNSITVKFSSNWNPPFQLSQLKMSSCTLGPPFPAWLKSQNEVKYLDLSDASILGPIPNWFWDISPHLGYFNISHNQLCGSLPNHVASFSANAFVDLSFNLFEGPVSLPTGGTRLLDLSHNCFSGAIPQNISHIMPQLNFLSLSDNHLSGEIPLSIGELSSLFSIDLSSNNLSGRIPPSLANCSRLQILYLSDNQLYGEIPLSLGEISSLIVINLSGNNLTGAIPPNLANCSFLEVLDLGNNILVGTIPSSLGQLKQLSSLHLYDNHFWGNLPLSFKNLSVLETIDLGNNGFSGIIPPWLGEGEGVSHLRILNLRSNAFSGELPPQLSKLTSLQVLDLARNNLSGSIPASLGDLKAIVEEQKKNTYLQYGIHMGRYYEETLILYAKDQRLEYTKTLSLVTSIDLSDNNFTGNLPHEITKLCGLIVLNLSRNHISGQIPEDVSNMHQLQSLDLSRNRFFGTIPSSMSSLSYLGFLNLSNNTLFGVIPYTGHMTTFDAPSFAGNPSLCGPPLPVKCPGDDDPSHDPDRKRSKHDDGLIDNWFYFSVGLGFAAGILVPCFILAIKRSWGDAYFDFLDQVIDKFIWLRYQPGINHGQRKKPRHIR